MPIPVQLQILDIIAARIANITSANGYSSEVQAMERAKTKPFKTRDLPAVNYYSTGDVLSATKNTGFEERQLSLVVEYYDITRDAIFLDIAFRLSADIKIALERDPATPLVSDIVSNRLGRKISRLEYDTITPVIGEGQSPYCGVVMGINIYYQVDRNDPFTLIDY